MIFLPIKTRTIKKIEKEAPHIDSYYENQYKKHGPFYEYDSEMNQLIAGYTESSSNSYAYELAKKYQLVDE